nr:unnamed protein product [Callosobruchus analis]
MRSYQRQRIVNFMKTNKFSIFVDESTDRSCSKNVSLIVRINCEYESIRDYFFALNPMQEATGTAIFKYIVNYLKKYIIPYK